jgi:hypothetical protein
MKSCGGSDDSLLEISFGFLQDGAAFKAAFLTFFGGWVHDVFTVSFRVYGAKGNTYPTVYGNICEPPFAVSGVVAVIFPCGIEVVYKAVNLELFDFAVRVVAPNYAI